MTWAGFLAWLAALSSNPAAADAEHPKAAAAVLVARASMVHGDVAPLPKPEPEPDPTPNPDKCKTCQGTGWIVHGDGHRTPCPDCQTAPEPKCPKCSDTGWIVIDAKTKRKCSCGQ